jgi:hypothetical protein
VIDDFLLRRIQPVADWLNEHGIAHLRVAKWLMSAAGVLFLFNGYLDLPALWAAFHVFCAAYCAKWTSDIGADLGRQEGGSMAVPRERLVSRIFRPILAVATVANIARDSAVLALTGSIALRSASSDILFVCETAAFYLWAALPRPPARRQAWSRRLATQGAR